MSNKNPLINKKLPTAEDVCLEVLGDLKFATRLNLKHTKNSAIDEEDKSFFILQTRRDLKAINRVIKIVKDTKKRNQEAKISSEVIASARNK